MGNTFLEIICIYTVFMTFRTVCIRVLVLNEIGSRLFETKLGMPQFQLQLQIIPTRLLAWNRMKLVRIVTAVNLT